MDSNQQISFPNALKTKKKHFLEPKMAEFCSEKSKIQTSGGGHWVGKAGLISSAISRNTFPRPYRADVWKIDFSEQMSVVFDSKKCVFFVFKLFGELICCLESILGAFWPVLVLKML